MVFKSLTTPAMEGAARGILCLDAVRVIVSPNVVEGRGEGGIGAVEGELILSACVVDDRGEGDGSARLTTPAKPRQAQTGE